MKNSKQQQIGLSTFDGNLFPSGDVFNQIARGVGLIQRIRKISGQLLFLALIHTLAFSDRSCRSVALAFGMTSDVKISRQAVWKILKKAAIVPFLEALIAFAITQTLADTPVIQLAANTHFALEGIGRILVGDASTICLHPSLAGAFPGSKNQTSVPKAHLKIQLIVDLITGKPVNFSLDPYQRSDMKAALDCIPFMQAGDLLIRDLGYSSMACFKAIIKCGAYFISRLKARDKVFDLDGVEIDLIKLLKKLAPLPGMVVRIPITMTQKCRVAAELIAIRVPYEVANERRRKLRAKHKEQGFNPPSKVYLARQDWTLLVTNLPESMADNTKIKELYLMRWRIEMIFKAAKSHSGLLKVADHKTNANHAKALVLAWVVMMIVLASMEVFALGRLREIHSPELGQSYELEIHNVSLFKTLERYTMLLGFYLEFMSCGGNLVEHLERTRRYNEIHNKTELIPSRIALSEILESVLDLNSQCSENLLS